MPDSQRYPLQSICAYCGSSDRVDGVYLQAATSLGAALAARGVRLIYGGGSTGLMGALAAGALAAGGEVVGVIPRMFDTPQLAHRKLTDLTVVDSMHERKAKMIELANALIALPGGLGTLEELFEALTWAQIGLHTKPIGVLNTAAYFGPFVELIDRAGREGFLYPEHRELFVLAEDPEDLLDQLAEFRTPSGLERWVERGEEKL